MTAKSLLFLVSDSAEDRRLLYDAVCQPIGAELSVGIPDLNKANDASLPQAGEEILLVGVSGDRKVMTALRFAEYRGITRISGLLRFEMILGARPTAEEPSLVRAFLTSRIGGPAAGRFRGGAPPLAHATEDEAAWRQTVELLADSDHKSYADTCFLHLTDVGTTESSVSLTVDVLAPRAHAGFLSAAQVVALDREGRQLAAVPGSPQITFRIDQSLKTIRLVVRHERLQGELTVRLPEHALPAADVRESPRQDVPRVVASPPVVRNPPADGAYQLLAVIDGHASLHGKALAEVAGHLSTWDASDRRLAEREARGHFEDGKFGRAVEVLTAIPETERSREAEALLVVTEIREGRLDGLSLGRYERSSFDAWTFEQLIAAVEALPPASKGGITRDLAFAFTSDRVATLIALVGPGLEAGPYLADISERIAEVSPTDAIALLERAGPLATLPDDALKTLCDLRIDHDRAGLGEIVLERARRIKAKGSMDEAVELARVTRQHLHWRDLETLGWILVECFTAKRPTLIGDDQELQAMAVADPLLEVVRRVRVSDLGEALEVLARLRQALEPVPSILEETLAAEERDVQSAFEGSEEHQAALAEIGDQVVSRLREKLHGKKLVVVGGRRADWWEELRVALGISDASEWVEVEAGHRPSQDWLKRLVAGGKVKLLVIVTDFVAHATSDIKSYAEAKGVRVVESRSGRYSMVKELARAFD
jgi:hypothetical protein